MQRRQGCCGRSDPGGKGKDWAQQCEVFLCYENVCNGEDRCPNPGSAKMSAGFLCGGMR